MTKFQWEMRVPLAGCRSTWIKWRPKLTRERRRVRGDRRQEKGEREEEEEEKEKEKERRLKETWWGTCGLRSIGGYRETLWGTCGLRSIGGYLQWRIGAISSCCCSSSLFIRLLREGICRISRGSLRWELQRQRTRFKHGFAVNSRLASTTTINPSARRICTCVK